jgi:UDP-galactopyranose mutase
MKCDVLIVGAGFAGMVLAERLGHAGKRCIIVDKRSHIGGNAYDYYDDASVLVHKYGPHLFHTNSDRIFEYLSRFTKWIPAKYEASSFARGRLFSFPINLKTYEQLVGRTSTTQDMEAHLAKVRVPIEHPKNSEEAIISQVGWELYETFYKGYVTKMWGCSAKDLDASVCQRLPIRTTRDALYFNDKHQCMPAEGYTKMFYSMLPCNSELILGADYKDAIHLRSFKHTVYTGPIDQFFGCVHGPLPYRSLRFEHTSMRPSMLRGGFWQSTTSVSYPSESVPYTRDIEIKHATSQFCPNSTIVREFPQDGVGNEPYYPIPNPASAALYAKYKARADATHGVTFVGRLARYQYLNMDQVVGMALAEFAKLKEKL